MEDLNHYILHPQLHTDVRECCSISLLKKVNPWGGWELSSPLRRTNQCVTKNIVLFAVKADRGRGKIVDYVSGITREILKHNEYDCSSIYPINAT